jgi:glycerol-3-phosphate dehydrogenase
MRKNIINQLKNDHFDLVVIGGGITGAGIALDAATRGLKTALIEANDYASGTSSSSTKLIHGGLRYLKQLEFKLVHEVGSERAIVHRLAPHLVHPEKMLLPLLKNGTFGKFGTSLGLWVYDVLANVKGDDKRTMLNKKTTLDKEPLLRNYDLVGGGFYAEYRTDDARLTIENIKTAVQNGAFCLNYCKANGFEKENGKITGVEVTDKEGNQSFTIKTAKVINAAGPWVDELRTADKSMNKKRLFLSKGVHLVVPHSRLPLKQSVYFDNNDGRMLFAVPRHLVTYIGTTDTAYKGDKNSIVADNDDVEYILNAANQMFPSVKLEAIDVISTWAGVRPLIYEEGKSASEMSRKDEVFHSDSGLISIAGGKLTGYRKMAERLVNLLTNAPCETKNTHLLGGYFNDYQEVIDYKKTIHERLERMGLATEMSDYLVNNYGRQTEEILDNIVAIGGNSNSALALAEADFCIQKEQALHLLDFFNRRTGRIYFYPFSIEHCLEDVATFFAKKLNWDETKRLSEIESVRNEIKRLVSFA